MFYRQHSIQGGDFMSIKAYPVPEGSKGKACQRRRRPRCNPTTEAQAWVNKKRAEEYFFYLIHNNYGLSDYRLDLDFAWENMPKNVDELKRIMRNFKERLRRRYRRLGLELKLVWIPECTELGRFHVHGFINGGLHISQIQKIWKLGRANSSPFQYDREGLAGYIHYVFKKPLTAKHWCATKNLKKPTERVSNYFMSRRVVDLVRRGDYRELERILPGWEVVSAQEEWEEPSVFNWAVVSSEVNDNEVNGNPYLYIRLCRRNAALSW